jgi:CRP-like cAMP-binding protein
MLVQDIVNRPLFHGLAPEELQRVAPIVSLVRLAAGQHIFGQGDPADRVYVLEQGEVALRLYPEDGGCLTISVIHPAGVFGWSAVLGRPRYTSAAVSLVDGAALMMRGSELRAAMHANAHLGRLLLGRLVLAAAGRTGDDHLHVARLIQQELAHNALKEAQ